MRIRNQNEIRELVKGFVIGIVINLLVGFVVYNELQFPIISFWILISISIISLIPPSISFVKTFLSKKKQLESGNYDNSHSIIVFQKSISKLNNQSNFSGCYLMITILSILFLVPLIFFIWILNEGDKRTATKWIILSVSLVGSLLYYIFNKEQVKNKFGIVGYFGGSILPPITLYDILFDV